VPRGGVRPACSIEGCGRPNHSRTLCSVHYRRSLKVDTRREPCSVDGCTNRTVATGLCGRHYQRFRNHGDVVTVLLGEHHPNWQDDDITYITAHQRIIQRRGQASTHPCVDCRGPAREWSYVGGCSRERQEQRGRYLVAYSPDPDRYQPRCKKCHWTFDRSKK
jgi:hypothetical protein